MKNIALKSLEYSEKFNVRKTNKNKNLGELVSSIKNHGLLENLIVIKGRKNKFEVVAGGRRLLALNELQKEGFLKAEHQVPCEIVSKKNAEEVSLAENAVRAEMHPADQFEAFAKLFNDGKSIADIAACFGVSDSIVEKRLKLGKLSPILMGAYREDKIKLEVLMAYTLTDDHSKQEEVYHATKDSWNGDNARAIRNMLTETSISATDKIVKFIGLDAYKDAGGTLRHDLFSEANDTYLEDLELVHKLADEKLQNKADELFKKWSWCETAINSDYEILSKYDRYYPTRSAIPEELSSEHEVISEKIDELESSPEDNEKELKKLSQKFTELTEKINSYTTFKDIEYKTGGCIISIDWHGDFQITEGLIRPKDKKKIQQLEKGEDSEDTEISSASNFSFSSFKLSQSSGSSLKKSSSNCLNFEQVSSSDANCAG
jgi:ParB family chromosome partitioning protein